MPAYSLSGCLGVARPSYRRTTILPAVAALARMESKTMDTKANPGKPLSEALSDELLETIDEELELEFDDQRLDSVLGPVALGPERTRSTAAPISANCCDCSVN
jgi:hypothetical protein